MPEIIVFTDPYGRTRKGYEKECPVCSKKFNCRVDFDAKYCSVSCSNTARKGKTKYVELKCHTCKKDFERRKSNVKSKSGLYFCSRKCKEFAQSLVGGVKEIQPTHYGTAGIDYRALFTEDELICARCGYDEWKSCVDIHHIDEDRSNNDKSNLIPLCCTCHNGIHRGCWKLDELKSVC